MSDEDQKPGAASEDAKAKFREALERALKVDSLRLSPSGI